MYAYALNNPLHFIDQKGLLWIYQQSTGDLGWENENTGQSVDYGNVGYSGNGAGLNNPTMEAVPNIGPIPAGNYTIGPSGNNIGPVSMPLAPDNPPLPGNRGGFYIHGDNPQQNYTASEGCIVAPRNIRHIIATSGDNSLQVVP